MLGATKGPKRRLSHFVPPPAFNEKETETVTPDQAGTSSSTTAGNLNEKFSRRRFSHDDIPIPIPENTTADDLDFVDTLTQGTFAQLVRVRRRDTNQIVVAKAFNANSWRSEYLCSAELRVLQHINSPWLLNFYGFIQDLMEDFILLEYLPNGSLFQLMVSKQRLSETQVKFYAAEMFLAVNDLHDHGVMHRNVQLSNFLLHSSGHLRICGFGLSYQFRPIDQPKKEREKMPLVTNPVFASAERSVPVCEQVLCKAKTRQSISVAQECTTAYLAPEVLCLLMPKPYFSLLKRKVGYSHLCDYWSLGVAIYHMLYGFLPFLADDKGCILDKVLDYRKTLTFPVDIGHHVSVLGVSLVKALLKRESKRLGHSARGFGDVQEHDLFSDLQWGRLGHGRVSIPVKESDVSRYTMTAGSRAFSETPSPSERWTPPRKMSKGSGEESEDDETFQNTLGFVNKVDFEVPLSTDPSISQNQRVLEKETGRALRSQATALRTDFVEDRREFWKTPRCQAAPQQNQAPGRDSPPKQPEPAQKRSTPQESPTLETLATRRSFAGQRASHVLAAEKTYVEKLMDWFSVTDASETSNSEVEPIISSHLEDKKPVVAKKWQ